MSAPSLAALIVASVPRGISRPVRHAGSTPRVSASPQRATGAVTPAPRRAGVDRPAPIKGRQAGGNFSHLGVANNFAPPVQSIAPDFSGLSPARVEKLWEKVIAASMGGRPIADARADSSSMRLWDRVIADARADSGSEQLWDRAIARGVGGKR